MTWLFAVAIGLLLVVVLSVSLLISEESWRGKMWGVLFLICALLTTICVGWSVFPDAPTR